MECRLRPCKALCCVLNRRTVDRSTWSDAGRFVGGADVVVDLHFQLGQQHVHHGHLEAVQEEGLTARAHGRGQGKYGATIVS